MEIKKCGWFLKKYVEANLCLWGLINTWWISRGGSNSEEESPRVHVERRKECPRGNMPLSMCSFMCFLYSDHVVALLLLLLLHQIIAIVIVFVFAPNKKLFDILPASEYFCDGISPLGLHFVKIQMFHACHSDENMNSYGKSTNMGKLVREN